MVRPRKVGRRWSFESLEERRLLAGDVTAKIDGGDLVIKGDDLANGIVITAGATAGQVVITGVNAGGSATNVNGTANGAVTLSGFTGKLKIKMEGGDDSVSITDLETSGKAKIKVGDGDDTLEISDATFNRSLKAKLGDGADTISVESTTVVGKTKVSGKRGDDEATITDSTFSKLGVSLGKDDDELTVSGTTVSEKTRFNGRGGDNTYTDDGDNSLADTKAKNFTDTDGTDPDESSDDPLVLNAVSAISEGGSATLTGTFNDSDTASAHTLKVDWDDPNASADSTFAVPAVGSLTVGQTITSSTDSGVLTITSIAAGTVGYSVQHRYRDDGVAGGNSTSSDTSTISVTVTGGASFSATQTRTVVVNDSAPVVALDAVTAVSENGTATLTGRYTDGGLLDAQTVLVSWGDPNNAAPSTFAVPAVLKLDGTANLTVGQTFNSTTDSGVLTIASVNTTTGQVGFSVGHRYIDDGAVVGNLTTSDSSSISVSVTDDDAKTGTNAATVTVNNVAPTVAVNPVADVAVNGTATLTGTYTDIGSADEHGLIVQWGDAKSSQFKISAIRNAAGATALAVGQTFNSTLDSAVLTIASVDATTGAVGFSVQHQYTAASTGLTISVAVADDDTAEVSTTTTVRVGVVKPTVVANAVNINESQTATLMGSFTNPLVSDTHDVTISWADPNNGDTSTFAVTATSGLTVGKTFNSSTDSAVLTITSVNTTTGQVGFSVQHKYTDDGDSSVGNTTTSDDSSVLIFVTGATAGSAFSFATVKVSNVAPTLDLNSASNIAAGGTATVTGVFTDIGLFDRHILTVNWNDSNSTSAATFTITRTGTLAVGNTFSSTTDGSTLTITAINATTGAVAFSVPHQYTAAGSPTVSMTIADDDSGSGSDTVSFVVGTA